MTLRELLASAAWMDNGVIGFRVIGKDTVWQCADEGYAEGLVECSRTICDSRGARGHVRHLDESLAVELVR